MIRFYFEENRFISIFLFNKNFINGKWNSARRFWLLIILLSRNAFNNSVDEIKVLLSESKKNSSINNNNKKYDDADKVYANNIDVAVYSIT